MPGEHRLRAGAIATGIILIAFGILAILSIGLPVLVAGGIVLVAGVTDAHRRHPRAFWPVVAAIAVFFTGYVLIAPRSCTTEDVVEVVGEAVGATACTNLVGIDYSGGPDYDPPQRRALAVGVGGGGLAGVLTRALLRDRGP